MRIIRYRQERDDDVGGRNDGRSRGWASKGPRLKGGKVEWRNLALVWCKLPASIRDTPLPYTASQVSGGYLDPVIYVPTLNNIPPSLRQVVEVPTLLF
jgi:hypothetical protein